MTRRARLAALVLSCLAGMVAPVVRAEPLPSSGAGNPGPGAPANPALPLPPTVIPAARLLSPLQGVPANGSLLFDPAGAAPNAVAFHSLAHRADSTVRKIGGYTVVTPTEIMQPNVTYDVVVMAGTGTPSSPALSLMFGPEWQPIPPELKSALVIERTDNTAMQTCCTSVPGFPARQSSCFFAQRTHRIRVRASITADASPAQLSQFVVRASAAGAVTPPQFRAWPHLGELPFEWTAQQTEYCLELEAIEITSGRSLPFATAPSRCVAHGELGGLEPEPLSPAPAQLSHTVCSVPPPGYELQWCEQNRAACEAVPAAVGCEDFDHLCRGGPRRPFDPPTPLPPLADPREPGPKPLAGALAAGGGGNRAPQRPMRPGAGFGCSAIVRAQAGDGGAIVFTLLTALWLRRRRRST